MGDGMEVGMVEDLGLLQLPCQVEGDMDGGAADGEGRGDVALEGVAYHEHLLGGDAELMTEIAELALALVAGDLYIIEIGGETGTLELLFLVEELALGEDNEAVAPLGMELAEGLLYLGEGRTGELEEVVALLLDGADLRGGHLVVADTHGRLEHGEGEGLGTEAEHGHVLAFGGKELAGGRLAVHPGFELGIELLHDSVEMALTVPQGVVGIESENFQFIIHNLQSP